MNVLVVEDDHHIRDLVCMLLDEFGCDVTVADHTRPVSLVGVDAIIADHLLVGSAENGCDMLGRAMKDNPSARRVLITGVSEIIEEGCPEAHVVVPKPFHPSHLHEALFS